jgi:hypothetical protein
MSSLAQPSELRRMPAELSFRKNIGLRQMIYKPLDLIVSMTGGKSSVSPWQRNAQRVQTVKSEAIFHSTSITPQLAQETLNYHVKMAKTGREKKSAVSYMQRLLNDHKPTTSISFILKLLPSTK